MFDLMHGDEEDEDGNEHLLEDLANRYRDDGEDEEEFTRIAPEIATDGRRTM